MAPTKRVDEMTEERHAFLDAGLQTPKGRINKGERAAPWRPCRVGAKWHRREKSLYVEQHSSPLMGEALSDMGPPGGDGFSRPHGKAISSTGSAGPRAVEATVAS